MIDDFTIEFQKFWVTTAGKVRAFMFCACNSWNDADDMTQDCYFRALKAWKQFDGRASREAWLFGIARKTRVDWLRQKIKTNTIALENNNKVDPCDISRQQTNTLSIEKIWEVVKNLSDEHKEVIHLKFASGLSYDLIAQTLDIPIGTVRSRLHRALKTIKEQVGDRENET
jgi:RNA polymerase sigma-70 factor, ECF subfamily